MYRYGVGGYGSQLSVIFISAISQQFEAISLSSTLSNKFKTQRFVASDEPLGKVTFTLPHSGYNMVGLRGLQLSVI